MPVTKGAVAKKILTRDFLPQVRSPLGGRSVTADDVIDIDQIHVEVAKAEANLDLFHFQMKQILGRLKANLGMLFYI